MLARQYLIVYSVHAAGDSRIPGEKKNGDGKKVNLKKMGQRINKKEVHTARVEKKRWTMLNLLPCFTQHMHYRGVNHPPGWCRCLLQARHMQPGTKKK
jgi:hypothetical protein